MAKCPACGRMWKCKEQGYGEELSLCNICRCPECRKKGIKRSD